MMARAHPVPVSRVWRWFGRRPGWVVAVAVLAAHPVGAQAPAPADKPPPETPADTASAAKPATTPPAAAPAATPAEGGQSTTTVETPKPAGPQTGDEAFDLKARGLEEQVNDLKEKILRTKARLLLLQEVVVGESGVTSGAKAVLVHRNEMGSSFVLESVAYALDGAPIFTKVDVDGDLDKKEEFEIFNGRIVPGQHQINVKMTYRGHGYGVFSYLEGYKFNINGNYTFNAEGGKITSVKVVGHEAGGFTTDLKDRPKIRYELNTSKDQPTRRTDGSAAGK